MTRVVHKDLAAAVASAGPEDLICVDYRKGNWLYRWFFQPDPIMRFSHVCSEWDWQDALPDVSYD